MSGLAAKAAAMLSKSRASETSAAAAADRAPPSTRTRRGPGPRARGRGARGQHVAVGGHDDVPEPAPAGQVLLGGNPVIGVQHGDDGPGADQAPAAQRAELGGVAEQVEQRDVVGARAVGGVRRDARPVGGQQPPAVRGGDRPAARHRLHPVPGGPRRGGGAAGAAPAGGGAAGRRTEGGAGRAASRVSTPSTTTRAGARCRPAARARAQDAQPQPAAASRRCPPCRPGRRPSPSSA